MRLLRFFLAAFTSVALLSAPQAHAAPDSYEGQLRCENRMAAAGFDPQAVGNDYDDGIISIEAYEAVGSDCGDFVFYLMVHGYLQRGDDMGAARAWALARSRTFLRYAVEPEPEPADGYAIYGALSSMYGHAMSEIALHEPDLYREGFAQAIAFDLSDPSIEFPPAEHPEEYADVRAALARHHVSVPEQ